jgi:Trypsin-co-occurring domain 1
VFDLARISLGDGGWLLVESSGDDSAGPVKAGRVSETVREWPDSLRSALRPVVQASREVVESLRQIDPDEVKVEFGVKLNTRPTFRASPPRPHVSDRCRAARA